MKFEDLTKDQLVELLNCIKDDVEFIKKCAADARKDAERGAMNDEWYQGRADSYEQSAKWINERFDKYAKQSTRP